MIKILRSGINGLKNDFLYKTDLYLNQRLSKPAIICIPFTYKCNFRCTQCYNRKISSKELTTSQWKRIITGIQRWIGPFYMSIHGGEPFIRKDVLELVKFSNSLGIITDIITNGSLIDKRLAKKITESGLDKITFSLDGANPKTHDSLRNFDSSFDRVLKAIKSLQALSQDLNISINTVITSKNLEELTDLVKLAIENNLNGICFRALICKGSPNSFRNDGYLESALWPKDYDKACRAIDGLIKLKNSGYPISNSIKQLECFKQYFKDPHSKFEGLTCLKHIRCLTVTPDGKVTICGDYVGNLLYAKPQHIWYSARALNVRKQKLRCKKACILKNPGDLGDALGDNLHLFYQCFKNKLKL